MEFNKLFSIFAQAGMRPGDPGDENRSAGIGIAEIERFRILQEQQEFANKSLQDSCLDYFSRFGKDDF